MPPQPTDIVLDGAGYMVAPGSYRRSQDGMAEGRIGRVAQRDFFGGGRRPLQLERDRATGGLGSGPTFNGQGVWPWPRHDTHDMPGTMNMPSASKPIPAIPIWDNVFFGVGNQLFKTVSMGNSAWASPSNIYSFGASIQITDLFEVHDQVGCCLGTGEKGEVIDQAGTYVEEIMNATKIRHAVAYAGHVIMSDARVGGATDKLWLTTAALLEQRYLDAPIVNMALWQGKVAIATRQSLWTFAGHTDEALSTGTKQWIGDPVPFHSEAYSGGTDDYVFLLGYGGKLYTWIAGQVVYFTPTGDRSGWAATGLEGMRCYGATIAGGYLVVAIETTASRSQLWAWDGAGWWCITDDYAPWYRHIWPIALHGAGSYDIACFRDNSRTIDLYRLIWRSASKHTVPASANFDTSMLDAGERDKVKAWRRVGAVFATPELVGDALDSTSTVTVDLNYAPGDSTSFETAATSTLTGNSVPHTNIALEADISSQNVASRFLKLRVEWHQNGGWAPVLTSLWAEYEVLDAPVRRRKWSFVVAARDQTIDRAGSVLSRTGRELIAELWAAWQAGTTLTFRDQDYDADPTQRTVRILGIEEAVANPEDAGRWGDAMLKITLVEV